jgi:hypothetical protein
MGKDIQLERARTLIENEGDPVVYCGEKWWYLRQMVGAVKRAVELLEKNKLLVRWSEKSRDVVRFVEEEK